MSGLLVDETNQDETKCLLEQAIDVRCLVIRSFLSFFFAGAELGLENRGFFLEHEFNICDSEDER